MLSKKYEFNLLDRIAVYEHAWVAGTLAVIAKIVEGLEACTTVSCFAGVFDLRALAIIFFTACTGALLGTIKRHLTDYKSKIKGKN